MNIGPYFIAEQINTCARRKGIIAISVSSSLVCAIVSVNQRYRLIAPYASHSI